MAVPQVGSGIVRAVDSRPRDLLLRVVRFVWWLTVTVLAAAGQANCGYGSVQHLTRSCDPEAFAAVPSDNAAIVRYASHGIRQIEEYLAVVAGGPAS